MKNPPPLSRLHRTAVNSDSTLHLSFWCAFFWSLERNIFIISKRTTSEVSGIQILFCRDKKNRQHRWRSAVDRWYIAQECRDIIPTKPATLRFRDHSTPNTNHFYFPAGTQSILFCNIVCLFVSLFCLYSAYWKFCPWQAVKNKRIRNTIEGQTNWEKTENQSPEKVYF